MIQSVSESDTHVELVEDSDLLLRCGVCRVRLPTDKISADEWLQWAQDLSKLTPEILTSEGDGEYAFYRNILDEPDFPFDAILVDSEISAAIVKYFGLESMEELRLDDAFCIQYHFGQQDTAGARHTDPSDITINICLEKTSDSAGSHVLFHGTRSLVDDIEVTDPDDMEPLPSKFLVKQEQGYATIHWGDHLHETTPLFSGKRTNIIMTLCYKDSSKSTAASRTCYT
jgi:hypothetical protein